jgi:SulP family sulfate permease
MFAPKVKALSRIPSPLIAMVLATGLNAALNLPGVATIGSAFGGIPQSLPPLTLPVLDPSKI